MKWLLSFFLICNMLQMAGQEARIPRAVKQAMDRVDSNRIRAHIAYLADDRLRGRKPGTEGYQMAVDYVIDQFRKMGVKPGGDQGAYTQKLIIRSSVLNNASVQGLLTDDKGNKDSLVFQNDIIPQPHPLKETTSGSGQLVFAGYGVDIPGGYSDYAGLDVRGKIVVVIPGVPEGLSSTIAAHFTGPGQKIMTAADQGATGLIYAIPGSNQAARNNIEYQSYVALNDTKTKAYSMRFNGEFDILATATRSFLQRIFMGSGHSLESTLASLKRNTPASCTIPYSLSLSYRTGHTDFESYNVIGLIPGSDPVLKNEFVVHTAHLDHVGVGKPVDGDSIYNGAHDNASGTASLLEIARIYKTQGASAKRSILIALLTAEEMGLLGSYYFASNPTVPATSIVADVNTDMPTVIAPLLSIVPLGAEHSSLLGNVTFAAKELGLDIEKDPEPEQNRFIRSDQYGFVLNGIPALHVKYGNKTTTPGVPLDPVVKKWRAKYYHQPADDIHGVFDFGAACVYVRLNFLIGYSIAQTKARPVWNPGDLFGAAN
ncbi:MAG: M28 family peptidase [Chitinophagaceae bacterium]